MPSPATPPLLRRALVALLAVALVAVLLPAPDADAGGFTRFQHGGRGVAQAGAFVARADSPFAVTYNPAGITELDGVQIEGGLDFSNATDEFTGNDGETFRADHSIQFPPSVYLTWSDDERLGNWALGLGLDTTVWYRADFDPVFFPRRFFSRLNELELYQFHPVVAYRLNEGWSVGGGLRYQFGTTTWGRNETFVIPSRDTGGAGTGIPGEALVDAEADVDGFGADFGVQYRSTLWGFGALFRSEVELEGDEVLAYEVRDVADPRFEEAARGLVDGRERPFDVSVNRPAELQAGFWFAPYPELRFEVDLAYVAWSDAEQTFTGIFVPLSFDRPSSVDLAEDWDDTVSLRLGVEGDVNDFLTLSGGAAWEPSPVTNTTAPWPRGDALVYAFGASFNYERVRFDLGYSFHDHDDAGETRPDGGTFTADEQVWSASARYTF